MGDERDLEGTVRDLVSRLTPEAALQMYDEVARNPNHGQNNVLVRQALVTRINRRRTQHARRLFTRFFQHFLAQDLGLLREELGVGGPLHPIDIGGLWAAGRRTALAAEARRIEPLVEEVARDYPIDEALARPELRPATESLRAAASAWLADALAKPPVLKTLLDTANAWRAEEARRVGIAQKLRPLTAEGVALAQAILAQQGNLHSLAQELLARAGRPPLLAEAGGGFAEDDRVAALGGAAGKWAHLPALPVLDQARDYRGFASFLVEAPATLQGRLAGNLVRHLKWVALSIADDLSAGAGTDRTAKGPLLFPLRRRAALDQELAHFETILDSFEELDLMRDPRAGSQAREALEKMVRRVEQELYPAVSDRVAAAVRAKFRPTPDQESLAWVLGYCTRWRACLSKSLHWGTGFSNFRTLLLEELNAAFKDCFAEEGHATATACLDHATRLLELAQALGADVSAWPSLLDKGLVKVCTQRLEEEGTLSPPERKLLQTVAALVGAELKRTRHWQDASLRAFADKASLHGIVSG